MNTATASVTEQFQELYEKYPQLKVQGKRDKPEVKRFEYIDQRDSTFVKESTKGTRAEQRLRAPREIYLKPEATIMLPTGDFMDIRFIPGAKTILKDEQEALGLKFVRENSEIVLRHGGLAVANDFQFATLFTYMSCFAGNKNSIFTSESFDRVVYEFVPEKVAKTNLDNFSIRRKAEDLVLALYDDRGEETVYKEERILVLCNMFGVSAESWPEKVGGLLLAAQKFPDNFIEQVGNVESIYRANLKEAVNMGVLSIDGDKATLLGSNVVIHAFESKKSAAKEEELIRFFLSANGRAKYQQVMIDLEHKKNTALNEVTS